MRFFFRYICLIGLLAFAGCSTGKPVSNDVVIWISIDGLRHDYVDRDLERLPTFAKLIRTGAFTRELVPTFPTLTFSSHVSQVTGVPVEQHGVTGNTFYDSRTRETYGYPEESSLIEAEPIWTTAARQGVRTAVIQWPMSYRQHGRARADYFDDAFNKEFTDADRLARLLDVWRSDDPRQHGGRSIRLLMGYVLAPDKAGHKYGPDSPELRETLVETDRLLGDFLAEAQRLFARDHADPSDRLWIVLTTDHGMTPGKGTLTLDEVLGTDAENQYHAVLSGPIANLFFDHGNRDSIKPILNRLDRHPNVRAWQLDQLPKQWHYAHPTRTGDVVAVVDVGYGWRSSEPTTRPSKPGGHHGYAVEDDPNMLGFALFAAIGDEAVARDLGRVESLQLHSTIARLLEITPTRKSNGRAIELRLVDLREEAPAAK